MGLSKGACLGFTYAMVDPHLSPYKNPGKSIALTQEVHDYQKYQRNRDKDQGRIKQTRLMINRYCSDQEQQAHDILKQATHHQSEEFLLIKRCSGSGHACYLSVQENGAIRYMDPNMGAYLFKHEKDFIDFYVTASGYEKQFGHCFNVYSLSSLKYDETMESKTWAGLLRSVLTGSKYQDKARLSKGFVTGLYVALGIGLGVALFASLVALSAPFLPTCVLAAAGSIYVVALRCVAERDGYQGLLGGVYYLFDSWLCVKEDTKAIGQDIKEYCSGLLSLFRTPTVTADIHTVKEASSLDSTSLMLSVMPALPALSSSSLASDVLTPGVSESAHCLGDLGSDACDVSKTMRYT